MTKNSPNLLQKLVRCVIRDLIDQANSQKADTKPKIKKPVTTESKLNQDKSKRSRRIPPSIRVSILHRDSYKCVFCGRRAKQVELEIDHILPFSKDGNNDPSNLQTLCFDCNRELERVA